MSLGKKQYFNSRKINDHLHQLGFVVVRGQENISRLISPIAKNTEALQQTQLDATVDMMDKDEYAMLVNALPKQQQMLMQSNRLVLPFFRQKDSPLCKPADQSSLNYFASAWAALENILLSATAEGLAYCLLHSYRQRIRTCKTTGQCAS